MAINLNRRRGPVETSIPLGNIAVVKDTSKKDNTTAAAGDQKGIASVVVTICESASYDELFRQLPQESEYGKVSVYLVHPGQILSFIHRALDNEIVEKFKNANGNALSPNLKQMLKKLKADCDEAGPDAVCFNFECCSGYSTSGFCQSGGRKYKDIYLDLVSFLATEYGCMTMFSDFSLKALITDWDASRLGPNPFVNVGEFGGNLEIGFNPERLQKSPSAQLNTVGSLSDKGEAKLKAMAGTIAFSLTKDASVLVQETSQTVGTQADVNRLERKYMEPYEVEVLTVATQLSNANFTRNKMNEVKAKEGVVNCEIGEKKGLAGHVLLTYPPSERNIERYKLDVIEETEAKAKALKDKKIIKVDGDEEEEEISPVRGMILVSCGHWIELMKIDVNMDRLLNTVKEEWGEEADLYQSMNRRYRAMSSESVQSACAKVDAVSYMQKRAPANFNRKLRRFKKKGY